MSFFRSSSNTSVSRNASLSKLIPPKDKKKSTGTPTRQDINPLHTVVTSGTIEELKNILNSSKTGKTKLNIDAQDQDGWTPLHCAANIGDVSKCEILLNAKASPTLKTFNDQAVALHYLVRLYLL